MPNQKGFISTALIIAVVVVVAVIAIIASRSAKEGQFLYPLKQAGDKVELALASGHEAKANIRFKLLERHIQEIQVATVKNDFDEVVDESGNFREEVSEINHDIDEISQTGKNADNLKMRLQSNIDNALKSLIEASDKASGKDKEDINSQIELIKQLNKK